ncbi:hypothetical protein WICPIJ_000568 [Wickerhamomyces pijperi]|uniref:Protein SYG1 n=1 Tax=Wickerhamomyces pijperi TaxID=599730 RepID=A0A9P8TRU9_WICPI|nr:hypothetical protein WICPIJ_000568 [Wickerhamomyces pijperi]
MKFAEYLQDNLVPEWKDRYLDYKAGKKKIKKINDSPKSQNEGSAVETPAALFPSTKQTALDKPQTKPLRQHRSSSTPKVNSFNGYRMNSARSSQSFELPPPALDPLDEGVVMSSAVSQHSRNVVADDHTPLLSSVSRQNRSLSYNSSSENLIAHKRSLRGAPHTAAAAAAPPPSVDLAATASIYGTSTFGDLASPDYDDEDDDDEDGEITAIALENFNKTAYDEFVQWLDKELFKINSFYQDKENRTVERFLLIQDQLFMLKEEREELKRKLGADSKGKSTTKKGITTHERTLRAKVSQVNKLELPSLPNFNVFKKQKEAPTSQDSHNKGDYEVRPKQHVPYFTARRQLKLALQEFYRELELLRSYRMLNRTGFRKLLKKCDKRTESHLLTTYMEKVNHSYFCTSDILENLIPKVEDLYSAYFENGNRKIAVEKLRSDLSHETFYGPLFLSGLFVGIGLPLLCYAFYLGIHKTMNKEIPEGRFLLQIWAGFFLLLLIVLFFVADCYLWNKFKVNYKFIFEFNPKTALDFREFTFLPSLAFLLLTIFSWLSFNNFWPDKLNAIYWPWFYLVSMLMIILCPFKILYYDSRKWLIITLWRLLFSGLYPVEFKDFFLGDIFCSLSYTMGNISFFFCIYATHWEGAADGTSHCSSGYSRLMGFFSTLPPIWRFLQCIRRYFDSGDWFPHLANMVKYGFTIVYYVTLSVYRIDKTLSNKAVFVFFASINSICSAVWDILMDWSLMQNKNLLRDDLVYPKWFYYFAMVSDVLLRFQWVFYALFGKEIEQSAFTSFGIGIVEIFRRFIWLLIRMENEHVTNIHLYRASRETPLPYQTIARAPNMSRAASANSSPEIHASSEEQFRHPSDIEAQGTPETMRRRKTLLDPEMFKNLSKAIVNAHAKDFQRKKPQDGLSVDPNDNGKSVSDDEDDENSDGEDASIMETN